MAAPPPNVQFAQLMEQDESKEIIGAVCSTWLLATLVLALRFVARQEARAGFWWDDWLAVPAFVSAIHVPRSPYPDMTTKSEFS